MMKWLLEWNRGRYAPSLGHLSRTEPSRNEKRHAFEKFYKGWRDCMEGRPLFAPPDWDEAARQWYQSGDEKAQTESPAKELVTTG
jgi:hypothetical protein